MPACNTKSAIRGKRKDLLNVLMDAEKETVEEICKQAGIVRDTYYKYMKDPEIASVINNNTINSCTARTPFVVRALLKQAEKGNIQAIRTVMEVKGLIGTGNNQTVNVGIQAQPTHKTIDYANDTEALADIDKNIAELQAYRASITNRIKQDPSRLQIADTSAPQEDKGKTHAIHHNTGDDHHEQT